MKKVLAINSIIKGFPLRILLCLFILISFNVLFSQNDDKFNTFSLGNTFIHSNGNVTIFGEHDFGNSNEGTQPGILGTERIPLLGYLNYAPGGTWVNALNGKFVDGYVRHFGNTRFLFPIGDNGSFRPAAVSGGGFVEAAYFGVDPTAAITSDIRGGFFPILPTSGPFNSNNFDDLVIKVSEYEYWDINGIDNTIITLTWDEDSRVADITSNDLERLTIVGWNGTEWEAIPSYVDERSINIDDNSAIFSGANSTLNSGSISTKIPIAPSDYEVYTLASSCINMDIEMPEQMLICFGEQVSITATSYDEALISWDTGSSGNTLTAFPFQNTTYTATARLGACEVSEDIFVQVKEMNVELGIDTFVCSGNDMVLEAEGSFGGSYQWEHRGQLTFGSNTLTLQNLNTPSTVNVTITDSNGCEDVDNIFIDIRQSPDVFTGRDASICQGDTTFLQAFGAEENVTYQWSTGDTTDLIYVGPMNTTTYEVSLTDNGCTDVSFVTVNVFPSAYVEITSDSIICIGDEVTITTDGEEGEFLWSNGETTSSITVTPTEYETFSVTVTSMGNCRWEDEITFVPYDATINAGEDVTICSGELVNLSVDGFYDSVTWSSGETSDQINVLPTETTIFNVTTTYNGCTATNEVTVFVDEDLTVDLGEDVTICRGESLELGSNAVGQYLWDTGENTSSITVSPFATRTYSVTVTSGTCIGTDEITVTVSQEPAFVEVLTDPLFCLGSEVLLQANSSEGNLEWSSGQTSESFTIIPLDGQTYSVTTTNTNGCTSEASITFEAFAQNNIDLGEDKNICIGEEVELRIEGNYDNILWSNGSENTMIVVSPLTTTNYSVTVSLNGCESIDDINVNVNELLEIDLGEDQLVCQGEPLVLSIENTSGEFIWSTGQTGSEITVFPSSATEYSVTVTSGDCSASNSILVDVESPTIEIDGDINYCPGENITLTAISNIDGDFEWSTGATSDMITIIPNEGTIYSVTVTSNNGCIESTEVILEPFDLDDVSLGEDLEICEGAELELSLLGNFDLIEWGDGSTTNSITISPSTTTTYTVTATIGACSTSDEVTVHVVENFSVDLGLDQTICQGEEITLQTSSAGEFLWSTGEITPSIIVSPGLSETYSVTVTSGLCSATDEININIEDTPLIEIVGEQQICLGETTSLNAIGPDGEYEWNNGEITPDIMIMPAPNETYTVTFTSPNGCSSEESFTFESFSINSVDLGEDLSICIGEAVTLELEGVYSQVIWSNGETGNQIVIEPTETIQISVEATLGTCSSSDDITINVLESLDLDLGDDIVICAGQEVVLTGNVIGEYVWSNGQTGNNLIVNPTSSTTYTTTVSSGGCTTTDEINITVENSSYVNIIGDNIYCENQQVTLETEGTPGDYLWSTGQTGTMVTFGPESGTTYYVTVTTVDGCASTDSITLESFETENISLGEDQTICAGENMSLNVSGTFDMLLWEDGTTQATRNISPLQTTTYSVTATFQGCESSDEVTVFVDDDLILDLGEDHMICPGEIIQLDSPISGQYQWSTGEDSRSIEVSPTEPTAYSLTVTSGTCTATDEILINVDDLFIEITNEPVFCEGDEVTIEMVASTGSYLWSTGESTPSITVAPIENVSYRVTLTSQNGCVTQDEISFTQFDGGDISIGPDVTICEGSDVDLMVTGLFDAVTWDDNSKEPIRTVSPINTTTYSVTARYGDCYSEDQITVFVEQEINVDLGSDITICPGQSVTLSDPTTGGKYLWSNGDSTSFLEVMPLNTTTYSVTVTADNCSAEDEVTVIVEDNCTIDLSVQKTVNDFNPTAGDTITFSILIENSGSIPATNVDVSEEIRSGFDFISYESSIGSYNVNTSMWSIPEIIPGDSHLLEIDVEVLENGNHTNVAFVDSVDQEDEDPDNDGVEIDIEVDIDVEEPDNSSEIGNRLWIDTNGNGIQNENERGLDGVQVELYSISNTSSPIETQTTGTDGYYCFTDLSSGDYIVKFIIPNGLVTTIPNFIGQNSTTFFDRDSDITNAFGIGTTNIINLRKNEVLKDIDGGVYPGGSIGDLVWKEVLGGLDDRYDAGIDTGAEDVIMRLYDLDMDTLVAETITDENGNYRFDNLRAGRYYIHITLPSELASNFRPVVPFSGSDDLDSNFDPISNKSFEINLGASQERMDIDAGLNSTVPITLIDFWGERIYEDNFNRLFWITAQEFNTYQFVVERALDEPKGFEPIGEVEAAGSSSEELYYTFDDLDSREAGVYYYRLISVDLDGYESTSKIVVINVEEGEDQEVTNEEEEKIDWKIYPIPTTDFLTIEIGLDRQNVFKGILLNNLGQHVRTFEENLLDKGNNQFTIDVTDLAQGQYYLNFYIGKNQYISKILVLD